MNCVEVLWFSESKENGMFFFIWLPAGILSRQAENHRQHGTGNETQRHPAQVWFQTVVDHTFTFLSCLATRMFVLTVVRDKVQQPKCLASCTLMKEYRVYQSIDFIVMLCRLFEIHTISYIHKNSIYINRMWCLSRTCCSSVPDFLNTNQEYLSFF